jgi:hypothetical protein
MYVSLLMARTGVVSVVEWWGGVRAGPRGWPAGRNNTSWTASAERVRRELGLASSAELGPACGLRSCLEGCNSTVRNGRADFVASNALARALYAPVFDDPYRPPNTARFAFLNPNAKTFSIDWDQTANDVVAALHAEAGRNPYDKGLTDLIGELSTRSEDFRTRWAKHNVHFHRSGHKRLHHPIVGTLDLSYEAMEFPTEPGLTLLVYTAEPATAAADALALLASWAATTAADAHHIAVGAAREDDDTGT